MSNVRRSGRLSYELDSECMRHLHDGFKARLGARSERLVEALTAQACVFGYLRHSFGPSYIAEREEQQVWIIGFKYGCHVLGDGFVVVEVSRRIECHELEWCLSLGHSEATTILTYGALLC